MTKIIQAENGWHLGDNIINFIFFYKIKDYIENNKIVIHYYCLEQYHKNLSDFKCSDNILILNILDPEYDKKGYVIWQGNTPNHSFIEDKLCVMFNNFLISSNIPIRVDSFIYKDPDLFNRYEILDERYKNIDILIVNSTPLSCQYNYNKPEWDDFIKRLSKKYIVATTQKVNDDIISLENVSVKNIAAMALNVKKIIAINTGPSIPLYNTDILNNVDVVYLFGSAGFNFKTQKFKVLNSLNQLSFL